MSAELFDPFQKQVSLESKDQNLKSPLLLFLPQHTSGQVVLIDAFN